MNVCYIPSVKYHCYKLNPYSTITLTMSFIMDTFTKVYDLLLYYFVQFCTIAFSVEFYLDIFFSKGNILYKPLVNK